MPNDKYDINDAIEGGSSVSDGLYALGDCFENMDSAYCMGVCAATAALAVFVIYLIYSWATKKSTFRGTNSNAAVGLQEWSAGVIGSDTSAPMDLYGQSVYSRNLQDVAQFQYYDIDPTAKPGEKGSAAYYVLNSDIMKCGKRDITNNPYAWELSKIDINRESVPKAPSVIGSKPVNNTLSVPSAILSDAISTVPVAVNTPTSATPVIVNTPVPTQVAAALSVAATTEAAKQGFLVYSQPPPREHLEDASAGSLKSQCPTIGKRIEDMRLTQSLMGY